MESGFHEIEDLFCKIRCLGEGQFGNVDLVQETSSGSLFALKKMDKSSRGYKPSHTDNEIRAGFLTKSSKGICQLINHWDTPRYSFLLMEFIEGEDLISYMSKTRFSPFKEEHAKQIILTIAQSLSDCCSQGIAHRDIKLDNIMIKADGSVKLIDFGLSQTKDAENCKEEVGSVEYAAPEILKRETYNGFKADVYSLGVVMFALLLGEFPFPVNRIRDHRDGHGSLTIKIPFTKTLSPPALDLLTKMLESDPKKRFSIKQVLSHPWIPIAQTSES
eukprot:TRINITY_DN7232_c0_g1_i1.p1 TRINITY_DN7232_c0_g1~~TRINITY_DN7232_c0_g1_i1.p1  ORF type:complete len:275 (+),score=45.06 TRINITY_DN7232_c0_g1_i1:91-915(+)